MSIETIVVATNNAGKVREIVDRLRLANVLVKSLADFPSILEPVEDGNTFEENALRKAVYYARALGCPVLADDSGLMVEALDGAPGVYSARYAGPEATDAERSAKILREMAGREDRGAAFVCALVLAAPSGESLTWIGRCQGRISLESVGENGFGYDPIFYYPPLGRTFAEISTAEKNLVSHRGLALEQFERDLTKTMAWLRQRMAKRIT